MGLRWVSGGARCGAGVRGGGHIRSRDRARTTTPAAAGPAARLGPTRRMACRWVELEALLLLYLAALNETAPPSLAHLDAEHHLVEHFAESGQKQTEQHAIISRARQLTLPQEKVDKLWVWKARMVPDGYIDWGSRQDDDAATLERRCWRDAWSARGGTVSLCDGLEPTPSCLVRAEAARRQGGARVERRNSPRRTGSPVPRTCVISTGPSHGSRPRSRCSPLRDNSGATTAVLCWPGTLRRHGASAPPEPRPAVAMRGAPGIIKSHASNKHYDQRNHAEVRFESSEPSPGLRRSGRSRSGPGPLSARRPAW